MQLHTVQRSQTVNDAAAGAFAFFERPENLQALLPPTLNFEILTPKPLEMRAGALFDYSFRLHNIPVRWTTLIVTYEPPHRFVEVQLRGPFSFWHHTHSFRESNNATEVVDEIRYGMRCRMLGKIAHALFVRRDLEWIFDYRAKAIEMMFTECARRGNHGVRASV